jgi:outer membrane protein OmpA-like peptidoglycan-associated protein
MVFAPRSATFEVETRQTIFRLARRMKKEPELKLKLVGYSDRTTDGKYAEKLGERRAKNVRDFLVQLGITADRISFAAHPPTTTTNLNDHQAAHHRRVEAILQ